MFNSGFYLANSSSGISALGFNGKDFIIQLITFVLAYFVLRRYAFDPIRKALTRRKETIENGVKLEAQLQKEKAELEQKVEKTLHDSRVKADGIVASANDSARQAIRQAEEQARDKASAIIKDAENTIVQNTNKARSNLESELVGLISEVSGAVIEEKVDAKKDEELIKRNLSQRQTVKG
ncbi:MAG TPA: F0F1 ATP synthase subunit B [Patescibacteria group bacterium]|nr:F0F1 ATP synthase subunit B [Patescibacteria group bacterium]